MLPEILEFVLKFRSHLAACLRLSDVAFHLDACQSSRPRSLEFCECRVDIDLFSVTCDLLLVPVGGELLDIGLIDRAVCLEQRQPCKAERRAHLGAAGHLESILELPAADCHSVIELRQQWAHYPLFEFPLVETHEESTVQ